MKHFFFFFSILSINFSWCQDTKFGKFSGGLESNSQWYLNDKELSTMQPTNPLRSNNYLLVNYSLKKWNAGIQVESYEKESLLNYNPKYKGTNLATFHLNYRSKEIDFTAGYFYEQFGSGMILRSWEDRALGINNAIRGARFVARPNNYLTFTALFGQHRSGFDISKGKIYGFNSEVDFKDLLGFETTQFSGGISFVGRDEKIESITFPDFFNTTNAVSYRLNFSHKAFYFSSELNTKSRDAILTNENTISNNFVKVGNAFLFNFGYTKKGLGIDASIRRVQNMGFFSERIPEFYSASNTSINYNDKIINYVPALTKQHHYNLANIYVYQAQNRVDFQDQEKTKAGEIGGQIDVFYDIKKKTLLGGKYGTKVAINISNWYNLDGDYNFSPPKYKTNTIDTKQKYFSDYNIEITKKISPTVTSGLSFINQYYNKNLLEGGDLVKANILGAESTINLSKIKSIKVAAEHLWANTDKKNWMAGTLEYNINSKLSFFVSDMYNYGNDESKKQTHYYNLGTSYRRGANRIAINYGRQRGGLVCVGGVCRFVPESTGVALSLNTSF
jgi:Family of unknown function (DUF6029)